MTVFMMIWRWILAVWHQLFGDGLYRSVRVEDLPDVLQDREVYLVGDNDFLWSAVMRCPCGCGKRLEMNLLPPGKPIWRLDEGATGEVSLHPSVWLKTGCESHFFLTAGRIRWV